ncbi:MAG: hypothetical protein ACQESP_11800 [Candidatus Muiribacteriota bacterium]
MSLLVKSFKEFNILGRVEASVLMFLSGYIFNLIIFDKYALLFNPKYMVLSLIGSNLMMLCGIYLFFYPTKSSFHRVLIFILLALFAFFTPLKVINPEFLLQFPY